MAYNHSAHKQPLNRHGYQRVLYELTDDIITLFAQLNVDTEDEAEVMFGKKYSGVEGVI